MKAEIITIGDELLIGQVINTNASYIGKKLSETGISVARIVSVGDSEKDIIDELKYAFENFDVVILTGGLGPTHDDVTKSAICKFFNTGLVLNEDVLNQVKEFLAKRGRTELNEANKSQALVPEKAKIIMNYWGTAPGFLFEENGKIVIVMPGVPKEMMGMMENFVINYLSKKSTGSVIKQKVLKTTGIPEAYLYERLKDTVEEIEKFCKIAFLPSALGVKIRITVKAETKEKADALVEEAEKKIREKVEKYIYGVDDEELEMVIGELLVEKGLKIAVAESCTGGLIADRITNVPGSSKYFERGIVAYSNEAKIQILGVSEELIKNYGAVSREVAEAMAEGVRKISGADIGISTTGIAGPTGATPTKPVGLVWIGYSDKNETFAKEFRFGDDRLENKQRASQMALEILRRKLLGIEI
ncbi:competence/damage-inducible protein A [Candidatus Chrysopegis kryptomonas]|uniref:CinA-like protein n=1 Tax=Candidatus Chryseopegocella kryptomonas TaxID=1633643 RepID=A0A0P1MS62_9BACT|nr:competence/damage-inducible protein A [Candidatus Chrysopegis kryptomonas]CUS98722.1 nicotinamide-nucleotide amidase [Candidatus Chrysopegis kryptomonas]